MTNTTTDSTPLIEAPPTAKTPGSAIAAFLLGITGFPGIVLGHVALNRIRRSPIKLNGKVFAWAGIIIGWLSLLTIVLVTGLLALGIFSLSKATESLNTVPDELVIKTTERLGTAIESYRAELGAYPVSEEGDTLASDTTLMATLAGHYTEPSPYAKIFAVSTGELSNDPDGKPELRDPWGSLYQIKFTPTSALRPDDGIEYKIWSLGPDKIDGTEDDLTSSPSTSESVIDSTPPR